DADREPARGVRAQGGEDPRRGPDPQQPLQLPDYGRAELLDGLDGQPKHARDAHRDPSDDRFPDRHGHITEVDLAQLRPKVVEPDGGSSELLDEPLERSDRTLPDGSADEHRRAGEPEDEPASHDQG